ncbi:uncharacterized protein LOC114914889 [Cajanus cajan]|uniref:uncharacterized protein LOC114914889 n=1 Tax=Cajanus cajan TaxID=3821 RepID=UPI0010FB07E5|nr:uncharacterized protein LOC114914889 [Cajanus cajan]
MRQKRSYQVEQAEFESGTTKKLLLDKHRGPNTCLWQNQLDLKTVQTDEEEKEHQKSCGRKVSNHANLVYGKLPLPAVSDGFLQTTMPKGICFSQHEMEGVEASKVLRNSTNGGSSLRHGGPENFHFIDSIGQSVACMGENLIVCSAFTKPMASDACTKNHLLDTWLRTAAVHTVRAPERSLQTDSSATSSVQSSLIDKNSGKYNCMDQSSHGNISSVQHDQMMFYVNSLDRSAANYMQVLLSEKVDNQKVGENLLHDTIGSEPTDLKGCQMKLTKSKNPLVDKNLESTLSLPTTSNTNLHLDENSCDEMPGNALDVFPPISARDSLKEVETCNKYGPIKTLTSNGMKGIITHYQNDGSHLYLLTPNILPPSAVTVHRWLCCDERGIY